MPTLDPDDDAASWLDAQDLWGEIKQFRCLQEPLDYIQFRRIGSPAGPHSAIGIQMLVTQDFDFVVDLLGTKGWAGSVVLSPADARRMAAALLDAADEASGEFAHVLLDEEGDVDDA